MTIDRVMFGRAIRRRREAAGMSQQDLAVRTMVGRSTIAGIENGASEPSLYSAASLAFGLGVTLDELIGESTRRAS